MICFIDLCLCVSWNSFSLPQLGTLSGIILLAVEGPEYGWKDLESMSQSLNRVSASSLRFP